MTFWFNQLKRTERHTLATCFGGWALDAFDATSYAFVIPALLATLHITRTQAGLLGTYALLGSALGGWIAGSLSDRFGRVKVLQLTIIWFSIFAFLSGFARSYEELTACRVLQGLGFGGEWATGAVLISESVNSKYRGKAVGLVQSGFAFGWGMALLVFSVLFSMLPSSVAWRATFWVGVVPALFILVVRRFAKEPDISVRARGHRRAQGGTPRQLFVIFSPAAIRTTCLAVLLTTGIQGAYYAVSVWLPTFLKTERNMTTSGSSGYLSVVILGALVGFLVAAWLADAIGRKSTFLIFGLSAGVVVGLYTLVPVSNNAVFLLGFPLGFFANGAFSPLGAYLAELFPTEIRATAQGFTYNAGRAAGSLFPALIGVLGEQMKLGVAIGLFAVSAYALLVVAMIFLPETNGRNLYDVQFSSNDRLSGAVEEL
jgi:MFS family permease